MTDDVRHLWLLGGIDPTGGAGLLRDDWAAKEITRDLGLNPLLKVHCVATAFTWQGEGKPARYESVAPNTLRAELARLPPADSIKVGLLPSSLYCVLTPFVVREKCPVVFDPVMAASDGGQFDVNCRGLLDLLTTESLVTPNLPEAEAFASVLGLAPEIFWEPKLRGATKPNSMSDFEQRPMEFPLPGNWLVKGGHRKAAQVCDLLVGAQGTRSFRRAWRDIEIPRGTGCTLATSIAVLRAYGIPLDESIKRAGDWMHLRLEDTCTGPDGRPHFRVSRGNG